MGAPLEELWLAEDVMPMGQLLLRSARRDPDKEALVFPDDRADLPRAGRPRLGRGATRSSRWASSPASTWAC